MARIRTSGVSGSSENSIIFIPAGGHSHDGVTSSLISTEKYSIYDFSPSFVNSTQSQTRAIRQENNRLAFESLVVNIVNQSVLVPAGIRLIPNTLNASAIIANTVTAVHLAANTITADEIAANTITADELVSNIILVNNIIRSNVYNPGSDGWRISNDGSAEFSNVVVRGNIFSNVGTIGGWTLSSNSLASGTGSTTLYSNGAAVLGNTTIAANGRVTNGSFTLSSTGTLTATNVDITGAVTATSGSFTGAVTATSGSFTGTVTSTSGRVGPFTLSSSGLTNVTDTGYSQSNFMRVQNYGDVTIFSNPSSGAHSGAFHRTDIFGENITISRHANQADMLNGTYLYPYLALGSFTNGEMELTIVGSAGVYPFKAHSNGNVQITGTITAATFSGSVSATSVSATSVSSSGDITANSADFRRLGGTIAMRNGAAAWWGSATDGGFLGKVTSSSLRYKTDITQVTNALLDPKKLLDVDIVQFRYKDGVLEEDDLNRGKYTIGFIAEDMYEKYQVGATIDEEGYPEGWNYNTIIPAMMSLIKDLNARIAELEAK
jgi:hypothetical protein